MKKPSFVLFVALGATVTGVFTAQARPEYAQKENKPCGYCHLSEAGGGARGFRGAFYGANGLSFEKFDEEREAMVAGLAANAPAAETKPKLAYVGNIAGPADKIIQQSALRGPVLVAFFDASSDGGKAAAKVLKKIALAYGRSVAVVGVGGADTEAALKLTKELGSQIRILPDKEGAAAKKFAVHQGLDLVVVSKMGDTSKTISGFSKGNLEMAIAQIGSYGVEAPTVDIADASSDVVHGGKISN